MAEALNTDLSAKEVQEEMDPLVLDLIAVFSLIQEDIEITTEELIKEGVTSETLIKTLEDKI